MADAPSTPPSASAHAPASEPAFASPEWRSTRRARSSEAVILRRLLEMGSDPIGHPNQSRFADIHHIVGPTLTCKLLNVSLNPTSILRG